MVKNLNFIANFIAFNFRRWPFPRKPPTTSDDNLEFSIHPILCLQDGFEHLQEASYSARYNLSTLLLLPPYSP